jgi:hypothetical protein
VRLCSLCSSPRRAEIDGALLGGSTHRIIADRWGVSLAALSRHRPHIAQRVAVAELEIGISNVQDVQRQLARTQCRLERLVQKLEAGKDHRTTLAGFKEPREGLKTIHDVLVASGLEARIRRLEEGVTNEDLVVADGG